MSRRLLHRWRARWRLAVRQGTPILLHHASFRHPPASEERLHNVQPEVLHDQLRWLGRRLRFVPVDELAREPGRRGAAAITFDDGYRSVLDEALPVLDDLRIPATVFVNGATLLGRPMWRQKVRRVIHRGWVEEWEREPRRTRPVGGKSFYSYTKDPANDSSVVDAELDEFLAERGETVSADGLWLAAGDLAPGPGGSRRGLAWGNHGHRHYVLSSLPRRRQAEEIDRTEELLEGIPGIERSRVFSLPFGHRHQMDDHTADLLAERGFTAVLLCRSRLSPRRPERVRGLPVLERFMPGEGSMLDELAGLGLVESA